MLLMRKADNFAKGPILIPGGWGAPPRYTPEWKYDNQNDLV